MEMSSAGLVPGKMDVSMCHGRLGAGGQWDFGMGALMF